MGISDDSQNEHYNVFMHFDFDEWEPDVMTDRRKENLSKKGKYVNHRMIPQGASLYFYSFNGKALINPNEASIEIDPLLREHIALKYSGVNVITVGDEQKPNNRWNVPIYNFDLERINVCNTGQSTHSQSTRSLQIMDREKSPKHREDIKEYLVISPNYEVLLKHCIPREPKTVQWTKFKRTRTPWTIDFGLFKEYLREEKVELNNQSFELDWSNVKELKYKKSTEDEVKQAMKVGY